MTLRVERIGDRLAILLTPEQVEALSLREDAELELEIVEGKLEITPVPATNEAQRVSADEAFAAYKRTEPRYAEVYRELAK